MNSGPGPEFPLADAHLHIWDAQAHRYPWLTDQRIAFRYGDYSALPRRYTVADYRRDSAHWRVTHGVHIEAEWDPQDPTGEMDFIARVRAEHGFPTVAIAQAWLEREDCAATLERQATHAFVRGVRHKPQRGQMDDARWRSGFARLARLGLHFELQAPWQELDGAVRLARDYPQITIVVNHAGMPLPEELAGWRGAMAALATCTNVAVKISGLGNLDAAEKRSVIGTLVDLFGTHRAMFASNYPVDSLRHTYDAIYQTFDDATRALSHDERRALFHDNAVRIYRME